MKILSGIRSGKSTKLIQMSSESGGYIICKNHARARAIIDRAEELNLHIPFPLTYEEFLRGSYNGRGIKEFYIDGVDELLQGLSRGVPIKAMSFNSELL